jgi:Tfp pilus assembly protein PilX
LVLAANSSGGKLCAILIILIVIIIIVVVVFKLEQLTLSTNRSSTAPPAHKLPQISCQIEDRHLIL